MNELTPMKYDGQDVKTIMIDGNPHWVAKEVASILGYKDQANAIKQHCKGVAKYHPLQTAGGMQEARIISESDLYRLIANSKLPSAEKFESWIFDEVLPTIRKTGSYSAPKQIQVQNANDLFQMDKGYRALLRTAKSIGLKGNFAVISANQAARKILGIDVMQVLEIESLATTPEEQAFTPTQLGSLIDLTAIATNVKLCEYGLQEKVKTAKGAIYMPTEKGTPFAVLVDTEKKHKSGAPITQLKWKQSVLEALKTSNMPIQ